MNKSKNYIDRKQLIELFIIYIFSLQIYLAMRESRSKGWQTMVNAKAKQQNLLRKSKINASPDGKRLQRFTPSKYQGKSMKIFSSIARSSSNLGKQSQIRVQQNAYASQIQHDDYQIKNSAYTPSQSKLYQSRNYISDMMTSSKKQTSQPQRRIQTSKENQSQKAKKEDFQCNFDEQFLQIVKPIEEKTYNYDILKTIKHEFQQFKKWVFEQLRKQQQMVIQLANQITKTLQQQPGKIKRSAIKRYSNNFKQMFLEGQQKIKEELSRESNLWRSNTKGQQYRLPSQQKIGNTQNAIKRQNIHIENDYSDCKYKLRPKSTSHFNLQTRNSRAVQPSPRSNIHFNKFFDTMNKIKNQINQMQLVTEKHEQSMTQQSRNNMSKQYSVRNK